MADGAVSLGKRAYDIAHKTRIRALLDCKNRRFRGAGRVSSLSVVWALDTGNQREIRKCINLNRTRSLKNAWKGRTQSQNGTNFVFIRSYSGNGTSMEPLYKSQTAYYDILGVSASATQAQIKTAYYKQSFVSHPDRNAGSDEATLRFSEINEAYTVLGNKALRKKYDRGLLSSSDLTATVRPSAAASSTRRQSGSRRSVVDPQGSGRVFDFDKFFKAHYSEQLQRERDVRVRKEEMQRKKEESVTGQRMDRMMEVGVGLLLVMAVGLLMSVRRS